MFRRSVFYHGILSIGLGLFLLFAITQVGSAAPTDEPVRVTFESVDHWTMDDAFLYWSTRSDECDVFVPLGTRDADASSTLKRRPVNGGSIVQAGTANYCTYSQMAANEGGVYYEANAGQQQTGSQIVRNARNDPTVAAPVAENIDAGVRRIVGQGEYVYFAQGNRIYRALKAGGGASMRAQLPSQVTDFTFAGSQIVAATLGGIYFVDVTCTTAPCAVDYVTGTVASHVLDGGPGAFAGVFHLVQSSNQELQKLSCTPVGNDWQCTVNSIHDAPVGWHISGLSAVCIPKLGGFCQGYTSYFVAEVKDDLKASRILRGSGNGALQEIALGTNYADGIYLNDGYVYWAERSGQSGIYRLPFSAAPLERDLEAAALEVTQAIQNLENDVPLVADKETYVIVHGRQLSGPPALTVEAVLSGARDGVPLPGSPLRPVQPTSALQTGVNIDRANTARSWIFRLPASWTGQGVISLSAVVDPRQAYADPNRGNNTLQGEFSFFSGPDACLFVSPVRTHASLPDFTDPNFWPTIQRFESLWPTDNTQIYWMGEPIEELECWGTCWGPYELDQGWAIDNFPPDKDRVIMKLVARHALSLTTPLSGIGCDADYLDPTFAVGMVHPDSDTTVVNDDGSTFTYGGYAWPIVHASWVKFPSHFPRANPTFDWPHAGSALAHEIAHNLQRRHVNCPAGKPDWPDDDYPYSDCLLDDGDPGDPETYFGFDTISRRPVSPTSASDFMSYSAKRWVSDYTYIAVRNAAFFNALQRQAARNELAAADEIVYISGFYDPGFDVGGLNYAYELAAENLDTVRLAPMLAPSLNSQSYASLGLTAPISGTLRFTAPNGTVLDEKAVELVPNDNYGEETGYFTAVFPALNGTVAAVRLVVDGQVVAETAPGVNPPQVTLLEPSAGASLDSTIRVRWQATDPDGDQLLHTVHYSPDNGQSWTTLVTDYTNRSTSSEVTLDLQSPETVPGTSTQSLIKIATSDGYHTTEVTSKPFTVADRQPVAGIGLPQEGTVYDAGAAAIAMGGGYDPEEGSLRGAALQWTLNGKPVGAGESLSLGGLAPGNYQLGLQATSTISLTNRMADRATSDPVATTLTIAPLGVYLAPVMPGLDGRCDDAGYAESSAVSLKPWPETYGGHQASVRLTRTETDLWVCFTGLGSLGSGQPIGLARLLVDGNFDHFGPVQGLDVGFQIGEDGTPQRLTGVNATGGWQTEPDLAGFNAEVTAEGTVWQAEMRIPLALISSNDGAVGLYLSHNVEGPGISAWPYDADYLAPATWAHTILGNQPRLDSVEPQTAVVGDKKLDLVLEGRAFAEDAVAYWDGTAVPTDVLSNTQIKVSVGSALLDMAGVFPLTVVNPGSPDLTSEARNVVVENQVPVLTSLSPDEIGAGSDGFTLTVKGSGFAPGATVYWDGAARATAFVSTGELKATIRLVDLTSGRIAGVTVGNPEPRAGLSAALPFTVIPSEVPLVWSIFLPTAVRP